MYNAANTLHVTQRALRCRPQPLSPEPQIATLEAKVLLRAGRAFSVQPWLPAACPGLRTVALHGLPLRALPPVLGHCPAWRCCPLRLPPLLGGLRLTPPQVDPFPCALMPLGRHVSAVGNLLDALSVGDGAHPVMLTAPSGGGAARQPAIAAPGRRGGRAAGACGAAGAGDAGHRRQRRRQRRWRGRWRWQGGAPAAAAGAADVARPGAAPARLGQAPRWCRRAAARRRQPRTGGAPAQPAGAGASAAAAGPQGQPPAVRPRPRRQRGRRQQQRGRRRRQRRPRRAGRHRAAERAAGGECSVCGGWFEGLQCGWVGGCLGRWGRHGIGAP